MRISLLATSEVDAIDKLANDCGFHLDAANELKRCFAHVWVARVHADSIDPGAFLLAWQAADELDIIALGTAPVLRRSGLARALVAEALRYASESRLRRVLLEVRVSNVAALGLYQSYGFIMGRQRKEYYSNPTEDGVEMSLEIGCSGFDVSTSHASRGMEAQE
jgi:[ribosomal protein S18]-alanine N-acetyltransferase